MRSEMQRGKWAALLLSAIVLVLAHLTALLFRIQPAVSLWFPPSGVAITIAIWFGLPGVVLTGVMSCLVSPLWGNDGWTQLLGWTDSTEPLVAWFLYRRYWQGSPFLKDLREAAVFILSAPVFACATSAVVGSLSLVLTHRIQLGDLAQSIPYWWLGNALGTLTIAPPALLLLTPVLYRKRWLWLQEADAPDRSSLSSVAAPIKRLHQLQRGAEVLVILVVSLSTSFLTVSNTQTEFSFQQFSFLNFVSIIWAAARFGVVGGTLTASFCVLSTLIAYLIAYPNAIALSSFPVSPEVLYVHKLSLLVQCGVSLLLGMSITQKASTQVDLAVERVRVSEYQARVQLTEQLEETNVQLERSNYEKDQLLIREQAARQEAESANRLKDEFLAVLSHELRSPLNPILGWAKLLRTRKFDEAATANALEVIERNAKLQSKLIEDLLDVSRILRGKLNMEFAPVNLADVVRVASETVRIAAEAKAIQIQMQFDPQVGLIRGDPSRLQQIIWNLLSNAVKFTPDHGRVEVRVERLNEDTLSSDYAQMVVTDTGKGIHPDFLPYVFDYFRQEDSTTTRSQGGLGLGLAIVRHLVELHGGTIRAESSGEGQGATFTVRLPLAKNSDERST